MAEEITSSQNFEEELKTSDLYSEEGRWFVNAGGKTIHASRVKGVSRNYKWYAQIVYLFFFAGPWLRWNGQKAIFFDIAHRQFHIFGLTIWPQDIWILALLLILLAITLVGLTAIAGRVFCGYFCFHTVWIDWFTLIERYLEGTPSQRRKLDTAPWNFKKIRLRFVKYLSWLLIGLFTAFCFTAYFIDPKELISGYLDLSAPPAAWGSLLFITSSIIIFPGIMREQVCFWLCPYARIQSVMIDKETIWPTYDYRRGEPRTKYVKGAVGVGDCIICSSCYNVCPTGVDIRNGMQEGCITCGMCIDACDIVMVKTGRPKGLIRYMSRDEMNGQTIPPLYKRPRILLYSFIFLFAATGIIYGLGNLAPLQFTVLHDRLPLYTKMSDGSIQNKYIIKLLNKTPGDIAVRLGVEGVQGVKLISEQGEQFVLAAGKMIPFNVFLRIDPSVFKKRNIPIKFIVEGVEQKEIYVNYKSMIIGPKL